MTFFVLYGHPKDYPAHYVVREWKNGTPNQRPTILAETLDEAKKAIPKEAVPMPLFASDDPGILEVWAT